ncbi:hypothetical protein DBR32_15430 [Taibaiella sp. KBW10]|uniref:hypothetical protein n=1 Tax=Taibaiella sp. KBW10 TaxID=2153357 RepID=UPI000F5A4738|nr:hypothetical protein [Taibaiella sp. KBW10]RQO29648.1 hypothetical protein DBR32_15430 [Taibaiella sp. KBW10]
MDGNLLSNVYWVIVITIALIAVFRYKSLDSATKVICWIIWLGLFNEIASDLFSVYYGNNYVFYNTYFYLEYVLFCLYFKRSVDVLQKNNSGLYIAAGGILLGILNNIYLQPFLHTHNSNFLLIECLVILATALYAILRIIIVDDDDLKLQHRTHFWLAFTIIFYQFSAIWSWGIYPLLGSTDKDRSQVFSTIILLVSTTTYLSYGILLLLYPKMRRIDVYT